MHAAPASDVYKRQSQRSTVQVADADDHVCTFVDSQTDHGLTILIRSVSLGDVVLAVMAHVAGNSRPACLVEALIVDEEIVEEMFAEAEKLLNK